MPDVEFEPPEPGNGKFYAAVIVAMVAAGFILAWLAGRGLEPKVTP
jgi:uncharacterized membrane protein (DUF441 family)